MTTEDVVAVPAVRNALKEATYVHHLSPFTKTQDDREACVHELEPGLNVLVLCAPRGQHLAIGTHKEEASALPVKRYKVGCSETWLVCVVCFRAAF